MPPNRSRTGRTLSSRQKQGRNGIARPMLLAPHRYWAQNDLHKQSNGLVRRTVRSSHNETFSGTHSSVPSNSRTHPSAGVTNDVSDQTTRSSTELASKRGISFHTPTTPTSSGDGDHFSLNGEAGSIGQWSPDAEQELQGIKGTNHYLKYRNVEGAYDPNLQRDSQYGSSNDLQPMALDIQESISAPIAAATTPLLGPWNELYRTYNGQSNPSDMVEESCEFRQSLSYDIWTPSLMQYTYEEDEQRKAFKFPSPKVCTNNQEHPQSLFTVSQNAYQEDGHANTGTPDTATSTSSESPVSSTSAATQIPGRRNGPLSQDGRHNACKMRKKGSCFRCVVMREKCVMDRQSKHDGMCERCRHIFNNYRIWNLPCIQWKLQDRLTVMLPEALVFHLRAPQVREYIQSNTNGSFGSQFKLEIEMDFGDPLVLDACQFIPCGQENGPIQGFQLTDTGSSTILMLDSPPIIPVLLDRSAIWRNISKWLDSVSSGHNSTFPEQCFPEDHEHWQKEILANICMYSQACTRRSETLEGRAIQALRRALKVVVLNHIMCHPFTVPKDKVGALLGELRNYQPVGSLEWVCPRVVNKVVKSFCLPMLKRVKSLVLGDLHKMLRSTTAKEAIWDQVFSIVFLCLIAIGKNQVALLERAEVCVANGDNSLTVEDAVIHIKEMEHELATYLIAMFHHRFSTNKKGTGKGKPFNPLARNLKDRARNTTSLMDSIRHATERLGWGFVTTAANLELLDLDKMKERNVTRLLCTFMRPFAPQDASA